MFVFALICLVAGVITLVLARRHRANKLALPRGSEAPGPDKTGNRIALGAGALLVVLGLVLGVTSSVYAQDAGEARVIRSFTGQIVGQTTSTGLHVKAPWDSTVNFNIRNQTVTYINGTGGSDSDNNGGIRTGPYITVQDKDGVSENVSLTVRYSIRPASVTTIYTSFRDEENFKASFITQDVRAVVREVPNNYSTLEVLTKRAEIETSIEQALTKRWADTGVEVNSISLQEIQAPKAVTESYAEAQQAQIDVTKQQAKLDATKVSAQQAVVTAQANAKANDLLTKSLSSQVLTQHYIDALEASADKGGLVVVPNGSSPLINIPKATK
ncbi:MULTISPECIES: prohibitin family protein [unclassified Frondihabitans]|uniref:prohibitin family protein n=1 Tax=unclassified Frondihabitans TaxID=2626248 RepID=UPI000F50D5BA|nr:MULTISPECIES: prohibitin family protein [unclassified Frondihabitans]RPE76041.1 regulator of protease activity HflC (stomatin/prohibitin superfamily) [Frondihabitans sp. PhB153]RPF05682.1 regulator of protease activity HflC (stomatin/prohibitin superfamily) [Frondihabitans sp. PhB161]